MGGRGQNYEIINRLKGYNKAKITNSKLGNYILNPTKSPGKSKYFFELGYNMKNAKRLQADIKEKLKNNKALHYGKNEFGDDIYQVNMLLGINKKSMTTTIWAIKPGKNYPEFVTAYHNSRLKGRNK